MAVAPKEIEETTLKKDDFETDQEVRWCPGCGDYSVLAAVQRFLPSLIPPEKYVFVSGIGCSSRFPYYMNTYGFHSIHGRAPAIASGVKLTNPDLSVWVITGDGDALSIGGNHFIHLMRRNLNLNILLFNNRIYGLTKGQYSPTSEVGKVTKSTPHGSVDYPLNPLLVALGAEASFVARTLDVDAKHMTEVLKLASDHRGTSFVEIYQNCNIFNDGAFVNISDRAKRTDNQLQVRDGELLIFGAARDRGIKINPQTFAAEVVEFQAGDEAAAIAAGVVRYNQKSSELASIIARLNLPQFPVPMGVLYRKERATFDSLVASQIEEAKGKKPLKSEIDKNLRNCLNLGILGSSLSLFLTIKDAKEHKG